MNAADRSLVLFKKKLLKALDLEDADFDLYPVTNARMNKLRQKLLARRDFKGASARKIAREKKVSVLAFPEPEDFPSPEVHGRRLGEVYLNLDFGKNDPGQLKTLMVHGVLHLLGYRHQEVRDTIKMEALEKKLRKKLRIPLPTPY